MAKLFLSVLTFLLLFSLACCSRGHLATGPVHISRINSQERRRIQAEGGSRLSSGDHNSDEFQCAGVSIHRHRIQPRGLMLPAYHNAPVLATFTRFIIFFATTVLRRERGAEVQDQASENLTVREGDILAFPAGLLTGLTTVVIRSLSCCLQTSNNATNLIQTQGRFFLAGTRRKGQGQQEYGQPRGLRRGQHEFAMFFRIDVQMLTEVFELMSRQQEASRVRTMKRGHIITVARGFRSSATSPEREYGRQEEAPYYGATIMGLRRPFCSAKMRENIDKTSRADIYNPRAGRFSHHQQPHLQFSASSSSAPPGEFFTGRTTTASRFRREVREGSGGVVPQNFAGGEAARTGLREVVEFNTNDNAVINTLSGRTSALRGLPADVIANAYQISREEAERLKYSRRETMMFSGSSRSPPGRERVASA
ncbi:11S globulin seed storage protein Jug r 4 [Sesamum alatum]|uniref:11S globulin seed storage protein Jug r 4 n=1 Tax=Sesamum alatum TaxID=300844 RepID=A0AAE1Z4W0_9LAMI|nr:11S globulin seed storage protein Jug r 4 [Sesamum alatum]